MKSYTIDLPLDLAEFVEQQVAYGVWGKPDILIAYALASVRAQLERAKQDGSELLLAQLRQQIEAARAQQAETDELVGGMMSGVPLEDPEAGSGDPIKDLNEFLQKIQQQVAAANRQAQKPG